MMLGEVEREIFRKYKMALRAIGVDFSDYRVVMAIEDCAQNLEPKIQAFIAWHEYLYHQGDRIASPTNALLQAFREDWQPIKWHWQYLYEIEERHIAISRSTVKVNS